MDRLPKLPPCPLCGAKCECRLGRIVCVQPVRICPYVAETPELHLAISAKLKAARGKVIRRAIMVPHKTSGKPYCICLGRIAKRSRCAGSSCQDVLIIADPAARKSGGK